MANLAALSVVCASVAPAQAQPVRSLLEMRQDRVITQDWDISCGAAVLATILVYEFGESITERDVAIGLMGREEYLANPHIVRIREGFSLLDMQRYVGTLGYKGQGFGDMAFEDLVRRAPIIVPVTRHGYNHFVIVRGARRDRVLIADPSFGNRTLTRSQFERMWRPLAELGRVGFIVSPPDGGETLGGLKPSARDFYTFG